MTRSNDTFLELKDRAKIANDLKADVFISIHANSGPSTASGTETYYYNESDKALANALHKEIVKAMGLKRPRREIRQFPCHSRDQDAWRPAGSRVPEQQDR